MNNTPTVSIIMIFLNEAGFIRDAVDSVLAQTYSDWELLLVDDGSTDESTEIALNYAAEKPNRIKYLHHPGHANLGMSASRNLGFAHACGEFVALLDADDVWLPGKLERQVSLLRQQSDVGLLFSPSYIWQDGVKKPQEVWLKPGLISCDAWLTSLLAEDWGASPLTNTVIMRRELVNAVGGCERSFRGLYEDQALWIKIALRSPIYYDAGECVALYRIHPRSVCQTAPMPTLLDQMLSFRKWVLSYFAQQAARKQNLRLPTIMARCNLLTTLLAHVNESAKSWLSRIRRSLTLARKERTWLGSGFCGLLIVGSIFDEAVKAAASGIRLFCKLGHTDGLRKSVRVLPSCLFQTGKAFFPHALRRSVAHCLSVIKHSFA
jgi:glycosyltransferase involved in cell wall biosynthesis